MLCLCMLEGVGEGEHRAEQDEGVAAPLVDAVGVNSLGEGEGLWGDVYLEVGVEGD